MTETQARIDKMLKKSEPILNAGKQKHNDIKVPPFTDGQKQLIEMTEKLAEKRGGKICDVDDDITDIKELLNDTIKRIEEPTNEDWLKSMTTEELAEWIYRAMFYKSCQKDVEDGAYMQMMTKKDYIEMWLKQPHT